MADKQRFRIVEIPGVPEQYANQFVSGGFDGSAIAITLGTARMIPDKMGGMPKEGTIPSVYVTTRLMLSVPAALEMIKQLKGIDGSDRPQNAGAGAKQSSASGRTRWLDRELTAAGPTISFERPFAPGSTRYSEGPTQVLGSSSNTRSHLGVRNSCSGPGRSVRSLSSPVPTEEAANPIRSTEPAPLERTMSASLPGLGATRSVAISVEVRVVRR